MDLSGIDNFVGKWVLVQADAENYYKLLMKTGIKYIVIVIFNTSSYCILFES